MTAAIVTLKTGLSAQQLYRPFTFRAMWPHPLIPVTGVTEARRPVGAHGA
jgi:hypothetical protein